MAKVEMVGQLDDFTFHNFDNSVTFESKILERGQLRPLLRKKQIVLTTCRHCRAVSDLQIPCLLSVWTAERSFNEDVCNPRNLNWHIAPSSPLFSVTSRAAR